VKRQAVIEIQRAVVAAETRAAEIMTQERLRMEKFFMEMSRHSSGERDLDNKSPSITSAQNVSWITIKITITLLLTRLQTICESRTQHQYKKVVLRKLIF